MRNIALNQGLALEKLKKLAGEEWRKSKYVYAISSIQPTMYQVKTTIAKTLQTIQKLLENGAALKDDTNFSSNLEINRGKQWNWYHLKQPTDLPEKCKTTFFTQQCSDEWFEMRRCVPLSGSTLYEALGLDTLKKQQEHFDKVMRGKQFTKPVSSEVQQRMDYGTKNEINAVATLVAQVLPFYHPTLSFVEQGSYILQDQNNPFIIVSPDGCGAVAEGHLLEKPDYLVSFEFKCPFPQVYKTPVHYSIPDRYILQLLAEMAATGTDELLYVSWSPESTTVHQVYMDHDLWQSVMSEAIAIYGGEGNRPTRKRPFTIEIKKSFDIFRQRCTKFLCEVPSQRVTSHDLPLQTSPESPFLSAQDKHTPPTLSKKKLQIALSDSIACITKAFELCRRKAVEVLVWLLSDVDRLWKPEIPHALPVAYAMKGYSLDSQTMRKMCNRVERAAHDEGIHIVCSTFDGQWISLAVRDDHGNKLTLIQLQRDTEAES